jgi:Family of unknown function (DUF5681)
MSKQGEEGNLLALHPTVKPVAMVADAILDSTERLFLIPSWARGRLSWLQNALAGYAMASRSIPPMWTSRFGGGRTTREKRLYMRRLVSVLTKLPFQRRKPVAEGERPYEVGYGKPPQSGRFAKGKSGNPKGRPKGSKNLASIVLRECRQPVRITGPHGTRTVTKLEATVMQLGNKAAQGEPRATRELLPLVQRSEEAASSGSAPLMVHELDQRVMQSLRQRMARVKAEAVAVNQISGGEESE